LSQFREAPARIPVVRAMRITAHVGPVSRRRIGNYSAAPNDLLASNRQHAGDATRIRCVRIDGEELLIAVDGVAIDRPCISIVDIAEIADRFAADLGDRHDVRRRRSVRSELGEIERAIDLRDVPGHLSTLREIADAQPQARKQIVEAEPSGRNHFRERRGKGAVRTLLIGRDGAGRGVEGDRHRRHRIDQRQAARQWLIAAGEWILSRGVENDDLDPARHRCQRLAKIGNADRLQRYVDIALDVGIDRHEIIFALELQAKAGEIDQRYRIRPGRGHLAQEFTKRFPQRRLIEIARAGDGKSRRLQRVGDKTGVVRGCRELGGFVFVIADHQREALFGRLTGGVT
jgi:hypothetical protein